MLHNELLEIDFSAELNDAQRREQHAQQIASVNSLSIEARAKFFRWSKDTAQFINSLYQQFNRFNGVWTPGIAGHVLSDETALSNERRIELKWVVDQIVFALDRDDLDYNIGLTDFGDVFLVQGDQVATYMWE